MRAERQELDGTGGRASGELDRDVCDYILMEQHVKPVSSAIAGSEYSLTPQQDSQNPLQLNIQLPIATAESRQESVKLATKASEHTMNALRAARAVKHKQLQDKKIRGDDRRKLEKTLEEANNAATAEVKKIVDSARKALEG